MKKPRGIFSSVEEIEQALKTNQLVYTLKLYLLLKQLMQKEIT